MNMFCESRTTFNSPSPLRYILRTSPQNPGTVSNRRESTEGDRPHLLAEFDVHRFAVAPNAVEHPGLDAAAAHGVLTQLTRAPV